MTLMLLTESTKTHSLGSPKVAVIAWRAIAKGGESDRRARSQTLVENSCSVRFLREQ